MGHQVKNFIGVTERDLGKALSRGSPNAMAMGTDGMAMTHIAAQCRFCGPR
jgi:manganese oxidase